jgi:hypothetical protein
MTHIMMLLDRHCHAADSVQDPPELQHVHGPW